MAMLPSILEVDEFRSWTTKLEVQRLQKLFNSDKIDDSDGIFKNEDSEVGEDSDLLYGDEIRADSADTMRLRNQRQVSLLRLPGELRNKIYSYLDLYSTKTRTVYTSVYIALSQTSRQLRTEVISYAMNHRSIYVNYANLGNFGYALKDVNQDDHNGVFVGINGTFAGALEACSIIMHLQPRWKSAVRYFFLKDFYSMEPDYEPLSGSIFYRKLTVQFLKERLHVGTTRQNVLLEDDVWRYVEEDEDEEDDGDEGEEV
ncbi:hypothetical protein G6514_002673 [Epicoccum nigrum]|nr:hypothetical protein G6514_002673 [Epicoccum nigrum]